MNALLHLLASKRETIRGVQIQAVAIHVCICMDVRGPK